MLRSWTATSCGLPSPDRTPSSGATPKRRSTPPYTVAAVAHPGRSHRRGPSRGLAARRRQPPRRGAGCRPPAPTELLGPHGPPGAGSVDLPGPAARFAEGGWALRRRRAGTGPAQRRAPRSRDHLEPTRRRGRSPDERRADPAARVSSRGHTGPGHDHGVGGPLRHHAARRSGRRGHPGRESVCAAAYDQGLPGSPGVSRTISAISVRSTARRPRSTGPAVEPPLVEQLALP